MKKVKFLLCACLLLFLAGCGADTENIEGDKNSEKQYEETKDAAKLVVFKNYVNETTMTYRETWKPLESSYEEKEDSLYAFSVSFVGYSDGKTDWPREFPKLEDYEDKSKWNLDYVIAVHESIKELMLQQGLMVLPECSYYAFDESKTTFFETGWSSCVAIGTKDKLLEVFSKENYQKIVSDGLGHEDGYFKIGNWALKVEMALRPDYVDIVRECGWDEKSTSYYEWLKKNQNKVNSGIGKEKEIVLEVSVIESVLPKS